MRRFKVFLALVLALSLGVSGCKSSANNPSSSAGVLSAVSSGKTATTLTLPYSYYLSLNPLTTTTMTNLVLWGLLYDCLAEPDQNYSPVYRLAASLETSGTEVTVHLRPGVTFSDGTPLAAKDVVYSYNIVRGDSSSYFYSKVTNIENVYASDPQTVVFRLKTPDPLFANLLDVPIIKDGTASSKLPTGSGRYILTFSGNSATLTANKNWYRNVKPKFSSVFLVNIPDASTLMSNLEIGNINYFYTDYGSGAVTGVNVGSSSVNLNQLVFLGVNTARPPLDNEHLRQAVSLSLDRKNLASQIYSGSALPCVLPFNPVWKGVSKTSDSSFEANETAAKAQLTQSGYRASQNLTLLVNSENAQRVLAAKAAVAAMGREGISVTLKKVTAPEYSSDLSSGNFDFYIGEIRLGNDMDLSPFFSPGGASRYGVPQAGPSSLSYTAWRNGSGTAAAFAGAFQTEAPFIPLCFRLGSVSYTSTLQGVSVTAGNIFYNIESWHY